MLFFGADLGQFLSNSYQLLPILTLAKLVVTVWKCYNYVILLELGKSAGTLYESDALTN